MLKFKSKALFLFACLMGLTTLSLNAKAQQSSKRILMLGDSITAGYGLQAQDALPNVLQAMIDQQFGKGQILLINAGVSGDTTAGGASRIEWLLADKPDAVIIALGGNDTLRGLRPEQTKKNLRTIIEIIQKQSLPILLAGMIAPRNLGQEYTDRFDAVFHDLAKEYGVIFYPFLLEGVASISKYNQPDGIHPNIDGVNVIVRGIFPKLQELIAASRATS